jgi:hypothetical protein
MASDLSLDDYNFNVTEQAHELLDRYSQTHSGMGKTPETAPFRTMKDVFMMAVYLGSREGRPRPLDGRRISPFKGGVFGDDDQMYLRGVAMGFTKDPDVIGDPQRVVRIAEEFANSGIWRLEETLATSGEGALWDLADYFTNELSQ